MILAISRFRVVNAMEEEVRAAFLARPRLVDREPGFLGMEVFTDAKDPSLFYLVTRWTDAASYHTWHTSEAHRLSHVGIPKGLKLNPAYTRIVVLDRIEEALTHSDLENLAADAAPVVALHLSRSQHTHLLVADLDGTVRACNPAVAERMRRPVEQIVGKPLWAWLTEADAGLLRRKLGESRRPEERFLLNFVDVGDSPFTLTCLLDVQPDHFLLLGEPLLGEEQRLHEEMLHLTNQLAVLSRENIRKSRLAEAARQEAEQARTRIDRILESITDGFLALDRKWRLTYVNPEASRILALVPPGPRAVLGQDLWDAVPALQATPFEAECRAAMREARPHYFEYSLPDTQVWLGVRTYPAGDGLSIYLCDTTEQKRLEAQLRRQAEELAQMDRHKDQFLATLGHELRSPLGAMSNAVHLLRRRNGDDPSIRRTCDLLERQLRHTDRLIGDLQDVTRIKEAKLRLEMARIDLRGIIEQAVETARTRVEERNHQLELTLPPEPLLVYGDAERLIQITTNLINNAVKYTDPGGYLWIRAERDKNQAVLSVKDTGTGIAPEVLPRVFDLFIQSERALSRSEGGLGIGLALVRGLVELHGGSVTAASAGIGCGSEFVVRIPLLEDR
jgi:signal transduction histidine kinase/heme-degrading monooxygenase HmoA